jgi:hypothetical protein
MSDRLETELRTVFAARLEMVSPEREARLCAFDYRSHARRHRRVWAAMGTGGTALTGGVVAAILMLSSGASIAEGWTPIPTAPSAASVAAATASCNWVNAPNGPPILTGTPALADGRGSYTAAIYVNGHVAYICISNGQHTGTGLTSNSRVLSFEAAPGPDQLGDPSGGGGSALGFPASDAATSSNQEQDVQGLAGSDVSAVTFAFADGSTVAATVQNGWYFAWWPGDGWPTTVQVTTGSGTHTSPMAVAACVSQATGCVFAGSKPRESSGAGGAVRLWATVRTRPVGVARSGGAVVKSHDGTIVLQRLSRSAQAWPGGTVGDCLDMMWRRVRVAGATRRSCS